MVNYIINKLKTKALTGQNLLQLVNYKCNMLTYPQLTEYNTIDDALGKHGTLILLYETRNNFGHWVCLFKRDKNTIEFFDSYGLLPDDELKFIPDHFRMISEQVLPHLTSLLYHSGYKVIYNEHRLQRKLRDVSTCGRHVACRINFKNKTLEDYVKMIKSTGYDPDTFVTLLTYYI